MCFLRTALANKRTHTQTQTQTHALTHAHARTHARIAEVIKNKGEAQLTTEQLTQEIMPKGRESVPDDVKAYLLSSIRRFVEEQS